MTRITALIIAGDPEVYSSSFEQAGYYLTDLGREYAAAPVTIVLPGAKANTSERA